MISIDITKRLHTASGEMDLVFQAEIRKGNFATFFGPSGAGKTTLLRILAGLTAPDSGRITVEDEVWFDKSKKININPRYRRTGVVFQDYALFPNMTVAQNIGAAVPKEKRAAKTEELLNAAGLTALADRLPSQLSGGQKQRVALARALAFEPKILLLDEPLSALDHDMRSTLQDEILTLHRKYSITTILISHDLSEVFKLSDFVYAIDHGKMGRSGTPAEVFAEKGISTKFKFTGEIVHIKKSNLIYIIDALVGNDLVRVVATEKEIEGLSVGSRILIASKAFNPIIMKI
jgi:molybdate transport system ATP-binding protein